MSGIREPIHLGILDLGKRSSGQSSTNAVDASIALAVACESYGYKRYWVGEHHTPDAAISCPEVLVPLIASASNRLRVGPGGLIAPYRSARQMAELGFALEALFPGRIDLGVCKGPGVSDRQVALDLVSGHHEELSDDVFAKRVDALSSYLGNSGSDRISGPAPVDSGRPALWVLGTSSPNGTLAQAAHGNLAISMIAFGDSEDRLDRLAWLPNFLRSFSGQATLAVSMVCADTAAEAKRQHSALVASGLLPCNIVGGAEECVDALRRLGRKHGIKDFTVTSWQRGLETRMRAFELLANAKSSMIEFSNTEDLA